MNFRSEVGKFGEDLAVKHLLNKSFTIIERNFRRKWGELDIVAKDQDGTLVFVEVKTLQMRSRSSIEDPRFQKNLESGQYGNNAANGNAAIPTFQSGQVAALLPEEQLTKSKLQKLQRTAMMYVASRNKQNLLDENKGWRMDLIAISLFENGTVNVSHYENI